MGPGRCDDLAVARRILHHPAAQSAKAHPNNARLFRAKRSWRHAGLCVGFQQYKALQPFWLVPTKIGAAYTATAERVVRTQGVIHAGFENIGWDFKNIGLDLENIGMDSENIGLDSQKYRIRFSKCRI